jgi:hypothetical protein
MIHGSFGKATAWIGLLASSLTIIDDLCIILLPSLTITIMGIAGIFWIVWWILISRSLLLMGITGGKNTRQWK